MIDLRRTIQLTLISISLALVYELKIGYNWNTSFRVITFLLMSYILTSIISQSLSRILSNIKIVRMISLNRCWVEGYWLIETYAPKNEMAIARGLMHITHDGISHELSITGYKLKSIDSKIETMSNTIYATINRYDLSYLSYWKYIIGTDFIHGISLGNFYIDSPKFFPTRYDGNLFYFSKYPKMRQVANKIENSEIKKYIKKYKSNWKKYYLIDIEKDSEN